LISLLQDDRKKLNWFSNSVFFNGKSKEAEDFLIQIVEASSIIIDRHPKGKPKKKVDK